MSLAILGIGTASPPYSIGQEEAAELAKGLCCRTEKEADWLGALYRRTQIRTRRAVLPSLFVGKTSELDRGPTTRERMERYAEEATPLALEAAHRALIEADLDAKKITHVITVSCTGFRAPGFDVALIKNLALSGKAARTHVGFMGCHGALNGLRIARALAESEPHARILLCAVELCSLHFFYGWDPEKVVANGIFSDGAAALVMGRGRLNSRDTWQMRASGAFLFPDSEEAMSWQIGDHGFEMTLSPRVPELIQEHLCPWLSDWLLENSLTLRDIRSWAVHPGGPRILDAVESALGLGRSETAVSREILSEYGNMSSPTLLFILERLRREKALRPVVALGLGPGLQAETALFG